MKAVRIHIPKILRSKRARPAPGSRPGTVAARTDLPQPKVTRITYNQERLETQDIALDDIEEALRFQPDTVVWIDIQGLGDVDFLQRIGKILDLHPLLVEDIAHTHQRPKIEESETLLFVTTRVIRVHEKGHIDNEQLSFVLKGNLLLTFQERPGDGFDPVRRRLREAKGAIRKRSADYLFYALLDATIDNYFPVLDLYADTMEDLEESIRENPHPSLSRSVHAMRRELRQLRRAVWPLREVTSLLGREDVEHVGEILRPAFRDCYDHVVQIADFVEGSRERASDLGDLYQTMVGERTNHVMKVLTMIATIFIPLTFLCGLYGMNFDTEVSPYNMPELKWRYGYVTLWAFMVLTLLGMLWFFRRQGWIGGDSGQKS